MKNVILIGVFLFSTYFYGQERIYIDLYGNEVSKEEAKLYREITEKEGIYHIKDFYLNGQLQMDVHSTTLDVENIEDFVGKYTFYHENGKIERTGEMKEGKKVGISKGFDNRGRLIYEEKFAEDGTSELKEMVYADEKLYIYFNELLTVDREGFSKRIIYDNYTNRIRYEIVRNPQDNTEKTLYYDLSGKLIGTAEYNDDYIPVGIVVEYYHNPMRVKSITQWNDQGEKTSQQIFYPNGKLFTTKDGGDKATMQVFYNDRGKKIGEVYFKQDDTGYGIAQEGTIFDIDEKGNISEKKEYKAGNIITLTQFYKNKKEKNVWMYDLDGMPSKVTFFTLQGKEKGTLTYLDGQPYQGTYYPDTELNDSYSSYQQGTLIEQKNYDENRILRYSKNLLESGEYQCQIYNDKKQRIYEYTMDNVYFDSASEIKIFQLSNGKIDRAATIKNYLLIEGSLSFPDKENSDIINIIERQDNWISSKKIKGDELLKEIRINVKYLDEYNDYSNNIYIDELMLSDYIYGKSPNEIMY